MSEFLFSIIMLIVLLVFGIHHGDPAQVWVEPIQCHKGCTLLPGDWPRTYGCLEDEFNEGD